jgi:hypothetical protein
LPLILYQAINSVNKPVPTTKNKIPSKMLDKVIESPFPVIKDTRVLNAVSASITINKYLKPNRHVL